MKLRNNKLRIIIKIIFTIIILYIYITLFINTKLSNIVENEIKDRFNINKTLNIKDKLYYNSLNKVVTYEDINNINNVKSVNVEVEEENNILSDPIIYIYNTHDGEKYSLNFVSDYSLVPDVRLASFILKDHLNDIGINSYVETRSMSKYLKKHNLSYAGSYAASRYYLKDTMKKYNFKILLDIHRDSVKHKYTLYEYNGKKYAKVMFVLTMNHKDYKKNQKFTNYLNNKINSKYKGLSRGIMNRKDAIFNQDLSPNSILIELGGVDNTIEELNNTLEVLAGILKEYIDEEI